MSFIVKPTPDRKYVRELLRRLPKGYRIGFVQEEGASGAGKRRPSHPMVVTPEGELLRGADGRPVIVCGSPGDRRALKNDLRLIVAAIEGRA